MDASNGFQYSQKHEEDLKRLKNFRLLDDDFCTKVFEDIECVELLLRIILKKDNLKVTEVHSQDNMKNLQGRSARLDIFATDDTEAALNVEVQRSDQGANPRRARYHSSVMDIENLDAGQEFKELPDTYTIFITERDFYGKGEPVYVIERVNLTTGNEFGDGEHILYVNGEYRGESELGRLMHDFNCINAADMNFSLLAERTRYLKENPEGVAMMCNSMEDMRNEVVENTSLQNIKNLMETMKLSAEQAMDALKIPDSDRMRYMERL